MKQIYLDNAATTQPSKEVILTMDEVLEKAWGNPSSIHTVGQDANAKLHEAREKVADFLNCDFQEVIFTSGGSESDNLAIQGIINAVIPGLTRNLKDPGSQASVRDDNLRPHVITSMTEHHAVLHTIQELEKEGKIEATYLKPDKNGVTSPDSVKNAIKDNTVLVSIMYVNNETGVIAPIMEIGKMLTTYNLQLTTGRIYFHTDAVQAAEWLPMDVGKSGVDLLTFTAHKIHGPKGIGVLYVKKGTPIKPEISGGAQEFGQRAGTENVASIAGLAAAIEQIQHSAVISTPFDELRVNSAEKSHVRKDLSPLSPAAKGRSLNSSGWLRQFTEMARDDTSRLRDKLIKDLLAKIPNSILNGAGAPRAPHIANISFLNAEGEAIILNLDFLGIAVSSGSACTSKSLEPSHVLTAMGIPAEKTHGAIRFSLSRYTKEEEIDKVIEVLPPIIKKLRKMSPFK